MAVIVGVCSAVLLMVMAGILFHKILGSFIEGELSALQFILLGSIFLIAATLVMLVSSLLLKAIIVAFIITAFSFESNISKYFGKKQIANLTEDHIERFKAAIESDPHNLAARSALVDALRSLGRYDEAVDEQTIVLSHIPDDVQEKYKMKILIEDREENITGIIICPHCGFRNQNGLKVCRSCEGQLFLFGDLKRKLADGGSKRFTVAIIIFIGMLALLVLTTQNMMLSLRFILITFLILLVIFSEIMFFYRKT